MQERERAILKVQYRPLQARIQQARGNRSTSEIQNHFLVRIRENEINLIKMENTMVIVQCSHISQQQEYKLLGHYLQHTFRRHGKSEAGSC